MTERGITRTACAGTTMPASHTTQAFLLNTGAIVLSCVCVALTLNFAFDVLINFVLPSGPGARARPFEIGGDECACNPLFAGSSTYATVFPETGRRPQRHLPHGTALVNPGPGSRS